jgi:hypothetical protein
MVREGWHNGIVAVLDALGAATYSEDEVNRFIGSREIVLPLLSQKADSMANTLNVAQVTTFTFNDTVVITLKSRTSMPNANEVRAFTTVLRKFLVDSLANKIMFRGSFAIGHFYQDEESNTVLGNAISDAAAWYEKADWIGIMATPRASIYIRHLEEKHDKEWKHLFLDYAVPLSTGKTINAKVINWPKVFWVDGITPCKAGEKQREKFLELLSAYSMPRSTESKHYNAIIFFDKVVKKLKLKNVPIKKQHSKASKAG